MDRLRKKLSGEFIIYLFFGGCSFLLNIVLYWILTEIVLLPILPANFIDWILTMVFVFYTNERWVFADSAGNKTSKILRFAVARTGTLIFEELSLYILVDIMELKGIIPKICIQIIVIIINYILSRLWVFKNDSKETDDDRKDTA